MPAKRGGVISSQEAHFVLEDPSKTKAAFLRLQIEAGDRVDHGLSRVQNQSDAAHGLRQLSAEEYEQIRDIVGRLVAAAVKRHGPNR